jgi:hypothetical protein
MAKHVTNASFISVSGAPLTVSSLSPCRSAESGLNETPKTPTREKFVKLIIYVKWLQKLQYVTK